MSDSTLFDLIPAYALNALSAEERAQVEGFLATSAEARQQLEEYQAMLAGMAILVPPRRAPSHLQSDFRRRLMQHEATSPAPPAATPFLRRRNTRLLMSLAAVVVLLAGVLVIYGFVMRDPEARLISEILNNPSAVITRLDPQGNVQGTVSLTTVPEREQGVLVAELPPLSADQQYQLWMIDTVPHGSTVFSQDKNPKQVIVKLPGPIQQYQAVGLTVEPQGGSQAPTTSPIFVGKVQP